MARLITTEGPDAGRAWPLTGAEVIVGRGETCHVQVTDLTVSRQHFRLVPAADGVWRLLDLGSRNRTVVNTGQVKSHSLEDGDVIVVGETRFLYETERPETEALEVVPAGLETVTMEFTGMADALGQAAQLAGLYRLAQQIAETERLDALYAAVVRSVRSECGADRACLYVLGAEGQPLLAARDTSDPGEVGVTVSRTVLDKVVREGKTVGCTDTAGDAGLSVQDSIVAHAIRSVMCAPVVNRGRVTGLLYADIRRPGQTFRAPDLQFLTCIAQLAGLAIDQFTTRDALREENARLRDAAVVHYDLVGDSPALQRIHQFIAKVGPTDATVMINGESGTGKELVAHAIHRASRRSRGPFIPVNCAALTESLLESELFGHEKGAFTGATQQKRGRFELADHGTLFLDEVGELPLSCQTKFLRVLEDHCFERVGGGRSVSVDVRVVAATNRDLQRMVDEGRFRADLFYRLQVIQVELPPLRDRLADVPRLVDHFVRRYAERMGRRVECVAAEAIEALSRHTWPGNVRELKNAIERALVLGDGPVLRLEDLPPALGGLAAAAPRTPTRAGDTAPPPTPGAPVPSLRALERQGIAAALAATGGNKLRAAELLEIDRSTLYKKIKDYGLEP